MGALAEMYIKAEVLETLAKTVKAKGEKGVKITISINEKSDQFGQNVSSFVAQSKEEREAKKPRYYVGNGRVNWTDGVIKVADKTSSAPLDSAPANESDDLPF